MKTCGFEGMALYLLEGRNKSEAVAKTELVDHWDYQLLSWQQNLWCWRVSNRCCTIFCTPLGDVINQATN